jgi:hypothetical protein
MFLPICAILFVYLFTHFDIYFVLIYLFFVFYFQMTLEFLTPLFII